MDVHSYTVFSDNDSFHLFIEQDKTTPGQYNYDGHEKLPNGCYINNIMNQINGEIKDHQFIKVIDQSI